MITIGVDLGIRKIAYSVWDNDLLLDTAAHEFSPGTRQGELMCCSEFLNDGIKAHPPDAIFIEDVLIGNNRKYSMQLAETKGAVLGGLAHLSSRYGFVVVPVNNKTWKKEILGNGNADKTMIRFWLEDQSNAYSVLCGNDQDRFDAACIGYYGYVIARRSQALAESGFSHRE